MTKEAKNCTRSVFMNKEQYVYNHNTFFIIIIFMGLTLTFFCGWMQEGFFTDLDTEYAVDFWFIAHFAFCFVLYIMLYLLFKNDKLALILAIILPTITEVIEYYWETIGFVPDYSTEILSNRLMDLVINTTGVILAYFFVKKQKQCK